MSDAFAQKVVQGDASLDCKRTLIFSTFSGWYAGWFQHFVYNLAYGRLYGRGSDFATVAKKIASDHFAHVPFICLPSYYLWQESLLVPLRQDGAQFPRLDVGVFHDAFGRWRAEALGVMIAFWKLWTPAHIVTFGFAPEPLRITWVAVVSAVWLVICSVLTHQSFRKGEGDEAGRPEASPPGQE